MRHRTILNTTLLTATLALSCCLATNAFAECGAPKLLNEVQMKPTSSGYSSVPIEINGTKQFFAFSTGSDTTQITRDAANKLGLKVSEGDTGLSDGLVRSSHYLVTVKQFTIGNMFKQNFTMPIAPSRSWRSDGVLSLNFMTPFDVDVDFRSNKLRFLSQDHCPGSIGSSQSPKTTIVPITIANGQITIPITLDGKQVTGVINTSAVTTSVKAAVAEHVLGLTLGSQNTPQKKDTIDDACGLQFAEADTWCDDPNRPIYSHIYNSLAIGNVTIRNVKVRIVPTPVVDARDPLMTAENRIKLSNAEMKNPVVNIGMDLLRDLHLYMAFRENKLYLTPSSASVNG